MTLDPPCSTTDAADLALARSRLAEASVRLRAAVARAGESAAQSAWQTPAARRFHERVEEWGAAVTALSASAVDVDDRAWWLQVRWRMSGCG